MAKKIEYIVIDGCIQDGRNVIVAGQPYSPPSKEVADALIAQGKIALASDPAAKQLLRRHSGDDTDDGE